MSRSNPESVKFLDLLALAGEHLLDCFTIVDMSDRERRCLFVNPVFSAQTGYPADEVTGKNLSLLQGKDSSESVIGYMRQSLDEGIACCADVLNYRRDGTSFLNRLVMLPIRRGAEFYCLGFQNILDHQETAEQKPLPEISEVEINHVLNNHLVSVLGIVEMALMEESSPDDVMGDFERELRRINTYCRYIDEPHKRDAVDGSH